MAFSLLTYPFKAYKKLVRYAFLLLIHFSLKLLFTEDVKLWSREASLAQEIINTELQCLGLSVFQCVEYTIFKLKQVNKAIDEAVLLSIAFSPIKILLNACKTPLRFVMGFLLKRVLQFILIEVETDPSSSITQPSLGQEITGSMAGSEALFQLKEYMNWKLKRVNMALDEAIPLKQPKKIREAMRHSLLLGGKRVRPTLCIASCQLVGGDEAIAMPMACAIEIIHNSWLIIEDLPCMDTNNDFRGGEPTTHKLFGEKVAILASAALFSTAFEHVAKNSTNVPPDRVVQAIAELGSLIGTNGLVGDQFWELMSEAGNVTFQGVKYINVHKIARLLEASLVCGGIIGGATVLDVEKIRKYARRIGLLFQMEDNIFDLTASTEIFGDTFDKDLMSDKTILLNLMGVDNAKKLSGRLVTQAIRELGHFDAPKAAPLNHLAYYIGNRQH